MPESKRMKIAQEFYEDVPGQILLEGSIQFDEEVPVTVGSDFSDVRSVIGKATDFQREKDKSVTALITLNGLGTKFDDLETYGATVFLNNVTRHEYNDITFIHDSICRVVFFTVDVPWAGHWKTFNAEQHLEPDWRS